MPSLMTTSCLSPYVPPCSFIVPYMVCLLFHDRHGYALVLLMDSYCFMRSHALPHYDPLVPFMDFPLFLLFFLR
jgi:hypothetical protein